jgi:tRNA(fMet)-specific endonuclease VapC
MKFLLDTNICLHIINQNPGKNFVALSLFLQTLVTTEFGFKDAVVYGQIRAQVERTGTLIGAMDQLIAAQAIRQRFILVSNNEREFRRIPELKIENRV